MRLNPGGAATANPILVRMASDEETRNDLRICLENKICFLLFCGLLSSCEDADSSVSDSFLNKFKRHGDDNGDGDVKDGDVKDGDVEDGDVKDGEGATTRDT